MNTLENRELSAGEPHANKQADTQPDVQTEKEDGRHEAQPVPTTPRRPDLIRSLTLQLPAPSPAITLPHVPPHSPAIPRHSRGLDFSRACTTLHHSTLAESSPDSSPVISHKPIPIPMRRMSSGAMALDSPNLTATGMMPWGSLAHTHEKITVSSSVGSTHMLGSDSETSESDGDASMGGDETEDPVFSTPQVHKLQNAGAPTPFQQSTYTTPLTPTTSTFGTGPHFSPAHASLLKTIRRTRLHKTVKGRSRKSSSSASGSGYSLAASPRNTSPPPMRSIETAGSGSYLTMTNAARSRRESLAMGTDSLHLSSGNDSGDEASSATPATPGVVRRPVVRRGNLLPKTKGFARIRAALIEEAAPVDSESRREAETIRQVRERDNSVGELDVHHDRPLSSTAASSPNLLPAVPECAQEDFGRDLDSDTGSNRWVGLGASFSDHASRNSGGLEYWQRFDPSMRTPPPGFNRQSSSAMSDTNMESPFGDFTTWRRPRARSSASDASEALLSNSVGTAGAVLSDDMHLQKFKKRPREDDFDIGTIKRRAVSPGMSTAQNSPVLTNSPSTRDGSVGWGQPPEKTHKTASIGSESGSQPPPSRGGMGGSGTGNMVSQGKKLGLQPMADTRDELMKMSIE